MTNTEWKELIEEKRDDLDEAIRELKGSMNEEEQKGFDKWFLEWKIEWDEEPDKYTQIDWIKKNCVEAVGIIESYVISCLMEEFDADAIIDRVIDDSEYWD